MVEEMVLVQKRSSGHDQQHRSKYANRLLTIGSARPRTRERLCVFAGAAGPLHHLRGAVIGSIAHLRHTDQNSTSRVREPLQCSRLHFQPQGFELMLLSLPFRVGPELTNV